MLLVAQTMDRAKLAETFVRGILNEYSQGRSGEFRVDGCVAYSYYTVIAYRNDDNSIFINNKWYSATTSKHVNAIKMAADTNKNTIVFLDERQIIQRQLKDSFD